LFIQSDSPVQIKCCFDFGSVTLKRIGFFCFPIKHYSTSPEVQTFTCLDPQKTQKGTNFRKHFLGSFSQTTPNLEESLSIKHAAPCRMRGLQLVDCWSSRPGEPFAGLPKCVEIVGQKEVSCAGLRGRLLGAAVFHK
jgi:hypothetical protein